MGHVDRHRIFAVKKLRGFGLAWHQGCLAEMSTGTLSWPSLMPWLVRRGDELAGRTGNAPEEAEF